MLFWFIKLDKYEFNTVYDVVYYYLYKKGFYVTYYGQILIKMYKDGQKVNEESHTFSVQKLSQFS